MSNPRVDVVVLTLNDRPAEEAAAQATLLATERSVSAGRPAGSFPPFKRVSHRAASPPGWRYSTSSPGPSSTTASKSSSRSAVARWSCHHHSARTPARSSRTALAPTSVKPSACTLASTSAAAPAATASGRTHSSAVSEANRSASPAPSTPTSVAQPSRTSGSKA